MRKFYVTLIVVLFAWCVSYSQVPNEHSLESIVIDKNPSEKGYKTNWTKNPFDHKIFIENRGQFDADINKETKILYQVMLGAVKAYFTSSGVIYRYDEYPKRLESEKEEREKEGGKENAKPLIHYLSALWVDANPNVIIDGDEQQAYYYTYPAGVNKNIKVNVFKKIVYRNIYPGIDIEYLFPEEKKEGIKYTLVVHPGADISKVKLKYDGANGGYIDADGNILMNSTIGIITDHAPVSYYQNGSSIKISYTLHGSEESFSIQYPYDKTKTVVIDPFISNPNFTPPYNKAYDVDYDNNGNVYALGSYDPYQLTKFNAAGVQQWTFNATTIAVAPTYDYGDFAVDKATGTCYIGEGCDLAGAKVLKVNTLGFLTATFPGNAGMLEMGRLEYNSCSHQIVIGGGGTNSPNTQACLLDTNMVTMTPVNVLNAVDGQHDVCLMALDPTAPIAYMATSLPFSNANFNNVLFSVSLPTLIPTYYVVPHGYSFLEVNMRYVDITD